MNKTWVALMALGGCAALAVSSSNAASPKPDRRTTTEQAPLKTLKVGDRRGFTSVDTDKNGYLTSNELLNALGEDAAVAKALAGYDADGDGAISLDEWINGPRESGGR